MTMPELVRWMRYLSARLRHVRVLNGDWARCVTSGASKTIPVRQGGTCGVFMDPPYGDVRDGGLYSSDSLTVAAEVQAWCRENGNDPDYRIVLAGFDTEHESLESEGWEVVEWYRAGFLKGGMGNTGDGSQQRRERLWLSPHCLGRSDARQQDLFEASAGATGRCPATPKQSRRL
jgi:DNA adenine methylase